jgi:Tol biopolymer transport system component
MNDLDPSWSLSGTAIGFAREGTDGQFDIWVMAPDGTGQQRLTTARGDDRAPAWAPDGKQILFISERAGTERAIERGNVMVAEATAPEAQPTCSMISTSSSSW